MPAPEHHSAEALRMFRAMKDIPHTINFYSQRVLPTGVFSNFFPFRIVISGTTFPTSEHFFQAMKFYPHSPGDFTDAATARGPGDTAAIGRDRSRPLRIDWDSVKDDVMFDAITAKFCQSDDLFQILMGTAGAKLVEHTRNDSYWGDGGDGSGRNQLGKSLMQLRELIISTASTSSPSTSAKRAADDDNDDNNNNAPSADPRKALQALKTQLATSLRETGLNPLRPTPTTSGALNVAFTVPSRVAPQRRHHMRDLLLPRPAEQQQQQQQQQSQSLSSAVDGGGGKSRDNAIDCDDDDDGVGDVTQQRSKAAAANNNKKRKGRLQ